MIINHLPEPSKDLILREKSKEKEVWGNFNKVKCILKKVRLCWLGSEYSECSECSDFLDYSDYSDLFILIVQGIKKSNQSAIGESYSDCSNMERGALKKRLT